MNLALQNFLLISYNFSLETDTRLVLHHLSYLMKTPFQGPRLCVFLNSFTDQFLMRYSGPSIIYKHIHQSMRLVKLHTHHYIIVIKFSILPGSSHVVIRKASLYFSLLHTVNFLDRDIILDNYYMLDG